jgi:hypothetical protein
MEETYRRTRKLKPFKVDTAALDAVATKARAQFPNSAVLSLAVDLDQRLVIVEDFAELNAVDELPTSVQAFRLELVHGGEGRHVILQTSKDSEPQLTVTGPTEPWCVGTLELVASSLERYRSWWWWLRTDAAGWIVGLSIFFSTAYVIDRNPYTIEAWSAGISGALFVAIAINRDRLMPLASLQLKSTKTLQQKYGATVTLLIAALSAFAAVLQVIQGFFK